MAGFCTQCGRPLPESGICSCTVTEQQIPTQQPQQIPTQQPNPQQPPYQQPPYQQPPYQQPPYQQAPYQQPPYQQPPYQQAPYQQAPYRPAAPKNPNGFGAAIAKLPALIKDYCKDLLGTTRRLEREANINTGLVFMLLAAVLTLFGTLLFGLVHMSYGAFFARWLVVGIFAPAIGFGISIGFVYALTALAKVKANLNGVLSVVGISSLLPSALLACSSLFSLLDGDGAVFLTFALLTVVAWLASLIIATLFTYDIKVNLLTVLLVVVVIYLGIVIMRALWAWYLSGSFNLLFYLPLGYSDFRWF